MSVIDLTGMSAVEILSLIRNKERLLCPKCLAVLDPIPKNWTDEMPLHGVECPNDQKHFLIYSEPERASKNMRDFIKDMIRKSESK
ncbi:hypothetical protein ACO0LF_31335 [Undibacterium sp. Di27W]|uniref:hypothetical protein n=1 Tax=Undibacterium sp. Di27W TaxID=3413036 RepID=UPI003BEFCB42